MKCHTVPAPAALFDPGAVWAALDPGIQQVIGLSAIVATIGELGWDESGDPGFWVAEAEACKVLEAVVRSQVLAPGTPIPKPDLGAIGVRSCHGCGCTDDHACPGGCAWIGPNRCSSCGMLGRGVR